MVTHLGMTGTSSRSLTSRQLEEAARTLAELSPGFVHHGVCVKADEEFHYLVEELFPHIKIIGHPPVNQSKMARGLRFYELRQPAEYLVRNHNIVDEVEQLLGFPKGGKEELRSGTWATIRYARRAGKPVKIILP